MTTSIDVFNEDVVEYQWYLGYDEEDEYDMNPPWTDDIAETEVESKADGAMFTVPRIKFYLTDNEDAWISSTTVYNLVGMR